MDAFGKSKGRRIAMRWQHTIASESFFCEGAKSFQIPVSETAFCQLPSLLYTLPERPCQRTCPSGG